MFDLFTSSSGQILLWKSAKVPALQGAVHSLNQGVDHLSHVGGERVEGGPRGPRAFEVSVLVALGAQQPLLRHGDVQEGGDEAELREQSPLKLLVVNHQQAAPKLQPAQSVGRPPGGVAGHKLWPVCRTESSGGSVRGQSDIVWFVIIVTSYMNCWIGRHQGGEYSYFLLYISELKVDL